MLIDKLRSRDLIGRSRKKKKNDKGFTLIELLVVITILGILAAVVIFAVSGLTDKGKAAAATTDDSVLRTAEEAYCHQKGAYADPSVLQREGFLASSSGYHDVSVTSTGGACGGYTLSMFTPEKTSYPVTVADCAGVRTTYNQAPTLAYAEDFQSYETMMYLGLLDKTAAGAALPAYLVPAQFKDAYTQNLTRFPSSTWPQAPNSSPYRITAAQLATLNGLHPDFFYGDSTSEFIADSAQPTGGDNYDRAAIQTALPNTKLYSGFSYGGCTSDKALSDPENSNSTLTDLARSSLEGVFANIRNVGIIFDVQEQAAQLISELRARIAKAIAKAAPGAGMNVVQTFAAGPGSFGLFGGNSGINGAISVLGAKNVFADQFPADVVGITSTANVIARSPDIIMAMGFAPNAQGQPDCTAAAGGDLASIQSALGTTPAGTHDRYVCGWYYYGIGSSIGTVDTIERLASAMAAG